MKRGLCAVILCGMAWLTAGCANSRDLRNVAIPQAKLAPATARDQQKFVADVEPGSNTVLIRKMNAKHWFRAHTKDQYERVALELPENYPLLTPIDINTPGLNFRFTRGEFDDIWQYNASQEGVIYVHRDTPTTVEVCFEVTMQMAWNETHTLNAEQAKMEPTEEVKFYDFLIFRKNDLNAYRDSNQMPATGLAAANGK